MEGQRRGKLRKTWKKQVEDEIKKISLKKEDALALINQSAKECDHVGNGVNPATLIVNGDKTRSELDYHYYYKVIKSFEGQ